MHYVLEEFSWSQVYDTCRCYVCGVLELDTLSRCSQSIDHTNQMRSARIDTAVINNVQQRWTVTDCSIRTLSSLDTRPLDLEHDISKINYLAALLLKHYRNDNYKLINNSHT